VPIAEARPMGASNPDRRGLAHAQDSFLMIGATIA